MYHIVKFPTTLSNLECWYDAPFTTYGKWSRGDVYISEGIIIYPFVLECDLEVFINHLTNAGVVDITVTRSSN